MERALNSLVLIRAKHLAESVTTPMLITDAEGNLVFYNEACETLLGRNFADVGTMPATEWGKTFNVRDRHDQPFPLEAMSGWADVRSERPGTGHVKLTTLDGRDLFLAVCAFPLFTAQRQFDGALTLMWQEDP